MKNLYISIKFIHRKNIERDYMAQGTSARESCPKDIELSLLQGPKNFEVLVESLKDKYSRGTVNKYLGELFKAGLVTRQGRRGPYELTPKGQREAKHEKEMGVLMEQLNKRSPEEIILVNKLIVENWLTDSILVRKKDSAIHMFVFGDPRKVDELRQYCDGSHPPLLIADFTSPPDGLPTIEEALKIIETYYECLKERQSTNNLQKPN